MRRQVNDLKHFSATSLICKAIPFAAWRIVSFKEILDNYVGYHKYVNHRLFG
jgi:transcriptional regulator of met regulon